MDEQLCNNYFWKAAPLIFKNYLHLSQLSAFLRDTHKFYKSTQRNAFRLSNLAIKTYGEEEECNYSKINA
jgi:hypothetical protein